MLPVRSCEVCGREYKPRREAARFCSHRCSNLSRWDTALYGPRFVGTKDEWARLNYRRHRDEILERRRAEYVKDKTIARIKARRAVPVPGPCEQCGSTRNVIRHHDDYSRPLDVRYLCRSCHAFVHGRAGVRRTA